MAEPIIKVAARVPVVEKIVGGGKLRYANRKVVVGEKETFTAKSTTPGKYVLQLVLPDGSTEQLAEMDVLIPKNKYARISARLYVAMAPVTDFAPPDVIYEDKEV